MCCLDSWSVPTGTIFRLNVGVEQGGQWVHALRAQTSFSLSKTGVDVTLLSILDLLVPYCCSSNDTDENVSQNPVIIAMHGPDHVTGITVSLLHSPPPDLTHHFLLLRRMYCW